MKRKFNPTEHKAIKYLISIGKEIDYSNSGGHFKPDIIDTTGQGYEIKRIQENKIIFEKNQVNLFLDKTIILGFEPFKNEPTFKCRMKKIKDMFKTKTRGERIRGISFYKY